MGRDGIPGRGKAINQIQGQAVSFHLALEQSTRGGPESDEVSQAGKQGSTMLCKGIWVGFLASGGFKQE